MHFPESSLKPHGFSHFGGLFGVRMHIGEWKIAENEAERITEVALQRLNDWEGLTAVGALVVTVFNDGEWRVLWPNRVVV